MSFPRIRRELARFGLPPLQVTSRAKTERQYRREVAAVDYLIERADRDGLRMLIDRQLSPADVLAIWRRQRVVPLPKRDPSKGFIYIARPSSNELKVGFTCNVKRRLAGLQGAHGEELVLIRAIPGIKALEYHAHGRFRRFRKRGEWYADVPEIREWNGEVAPVPSEGEL